MRSKPITTTLIENLLATAKAFCRAKGCSMETASRYCHGSPDALPNLESGEGSITFRKYEDAMDWFERKWPDGITRPALATFSVRKPKAK